MPKKVYCVELDSTLEEEEELSLQIINGTTSLELHLSGEQGTINSIKMVENEFIEIRTGESTILISLISRNFNKDRGWSLDEDRWVE